MLNDGRDVVVIKAGTEKAGETIGIGISSGQFGEVPGQCVFVQTRGYRELAVKTNALRNVAEQLLYGACADGRQHFRFVLFS
ncbi:hypothetical protein D3C74_281410 [compost metagenome]